MLPPAEKPSVLGEIIQPYPSQLKPTEGTTDFPEARRGLLPVNLAFTLSTAGED